MEIYQGEEDEESAPLSQMCLAETLLRRLGCLFITSALVLTCYPQNFMKGKAGQCHTPKHHASRSLRGRPGVQA